MIRSALRDKLRMQLGETTASFWTDTQLNTWINDTIRDIAWRTKCLRKNAYMTPVEDTMEYTLSSYFSDLKDFIEVYFKTDGTTWKKLTNITRAELDIEYEGWLSAASGVPDLYSYDVEENWLLLWPPPDENNDGASYVRAYYVYEPTDLTLDAQEPQIPDVLHDAVIEGVKVTAYESRGLGDRANNSRSIYYNAIKDYLIQRDLHDDGEIRMRSYKN